MRSRGGAKGPGGVRRGSRWTLDRRRIKVKRLEDLAREHTQGKWFLVILKVIRTRRAGVERGDEAIACGTNNDLPRGFVSVPAVILVVWRWLFDTDSAKANLLANKIISQSNVFHTTCVTFVANETSL